MRRIRTYLESESPAGPFLLFRTVWSTILLILPLRYFLNGWIESYFYEPEFFFSFLDFAWYGPLPAPGMYILFGALCALALGIGLGWRYRLAAAAYAVLFAYFLSIDKTIYLNHYYLVFLLTTLLAALPAPHSSNSTPVNAGSMHSKLVVPRISELSIKAMIAVVYLYAALAKVRYDWLIDAMPLRIWLPARVDSFPGGEWLAIPALAWVFAWGGLLFDGSIAFFLFARRTAPYAFLAVVFFHITTALLFRIGMFPWIMIAANTIFLGPLTFLSDGLYQRTLGRFLKREPAHEEAVTSFADGGQRISAVRASGRQRFSGRMLQRICELSGSSVAGTRLYRQKLFTGLLLVFILLQIVLPARRFLYPGKTTWNEYGFRFSWQVMVMQKSGLCEFTIHKGERQLRLNPSEILSPYQEMMMSTQPDMILQFGRYLSRRFGAGSPSGTASVFAHCLVSLNGRPHQPMVRSDVDLSDPDVIEKDIIIPFSQ
ncbi:MAG: HTTM domain-containing protein [Leptospiraceae bacterium]|nr:HTTM domain-containing protein [Leptospiraceae bacterium]